jgi:hypothetical protein
MPYGSLTPPQEQVVRDAVTGRSVIDIGCGDMHYSKRFLQMGALSVVALDKCDLPEHEYGIEIAHTSIDKFERANPDKTFDVGFLSWPVNRLIPGLAALLRRCTTVIYYGSNTGGSACGDPTLFNALLSRRLDHYIPDRRSSLIVCSEALSQPRAPTGEEKAALDPVTLFQFDQVHPGSPTR